MEVRVNVYDLTPYNQYIGPFGIGLYHSGVEVYGREYCYGGHLFTNSGVFTMRPRAGVPGIVLRESILLGRTVLTEGEVDGVAAQLGRSEYRGIDYNILTRNCNHFADSFAKRICGHSIPKWINRLAYLGTLVPPSLLPVVTNVPVAPDPTPRDGRQVPSPSTANTFKNKQ